MQYTVLYCTVLYCTGQKQSVERVVLLAVRLPPTTNHPLSQNKSETETTKFITFFFQQRKQSTLSQDNGQEKGQIQPRHAQG